MSENTPDQTTELTPPAEKPAPSPRARSAGGTRKNGSARKTGPKRPAGLHDAADKLAPVRPEPVERPYDDAVTAEQRQAMKDHGLA